MRGITCDGSVVRTKLSPRANVAALQSCACLIHPVRVGVESHRRTLDAARVVTIEPGTLWDVLASVFQLTSALNTVVPSLATVVSNVASPGSTWGVVVLLHGDPSDARRIVIVGEAEVARNPAWAD